MPAIPCGCAARKDIMFTQGQPGIFEGAIIAGAIVILIVAWRLHR